MKKNLKPYRRFLHHTRGILSENPVLVYGLTLPLAVVMSTSLQNAAASSLAILLTTVPLMGLNTLMGKVFVEDRKLYRLPFFVVLASLILFFITPLIQPISLNIFDSLGIYYPLIAINSLLLGLISDGEERSLPTALGDGLRHSLGFAVAVFTLAFFRELVGSGSLWGVPIKIPVLVPSVLTPFFGFIFLGLLAAGARVANRMIKARILHPRGEKKPAKWLPHR